MPPARKPFAEHHEADWDESFEIGSLLLILYNIRAKRRKSTAPCNVGGNSAMGAMYSLGD